MEEIIAEKRLPKIRQCVLVVMAMFALALVFEALTLIGAPVSSVFDLGAWGKKRILVVWAIFVVLYALLWYFGGIASFKEWTARILINKHVVVRRALYLVCGFVIVGLLGVVVFYLASLLGFFVFGVAKSVFAFALAGCGFLVFANRENFGSYPERVFVPVGICAGVFFAVLAPVQPVVSFDDQIHYDHAVGLSFLSSAEYTKADVEMLAYPEIEGDPFKHLQFSESEYGALLNDLNALGEEHAFNSDGFYSSWGYKSLDYLSLGYIPNAIGLWLGRLLHLPFVGVFLLGRISGVLFFFTLVYLAVKKLKSQKILALAFALLPSVLFISGSYSYDIWVAGWLLFGFLRYLSWLQSPDEKLSFKEVALVLLAFVIGLGPKAIYFPIFFLLLFIPKSKFPSKIFARRYRVAVVVSALLVLSTFLLPFVVQGPGTGDVRGGSDVNSTGQVMFILEDPLRYAGILANFLSGYLSIEYSATYTNHLGYLGVSTLGVLPLVALLLVAVTDSGPLNYSYAKVRYKIGALSLLVGTAALMASALYVSFTAVGSETVAGCQGRYLLPLVVPFLALFFCSRINNENLRPRYNLAVLLVWLLLIAVCADQLSLGVYSG